MSGHVSKVDSPTGGHDQVASPMGSGKSSFLHVVWSYLEGDPRFNADLNGHPTKIGFTESQWSLWEQLQLGATRTEVRTFQFDAASPDQWWSESLPSQIDLVVPLGSSLIRAEAKPTRTIRFVAAPGAGDIPPLDALDLTQAHESGHRRMCRLGVDDVPLKPQSLIEKSLGVPQTDPLDFAPALDADAATDRFRRLIARVTRAVNHILDADRADHRRIDQVFDHCLTRLKKIVFGTRSGRRKTDLDVGESLTLGHTIDCPTIRGPSFLQMSEFTSICREPALV